MAAETLGLFGLAVQNCTLEEAVHLIVDRALTRRATTVAFLNAHGVNVAYRDDAYRAALEHADLIFADGTGVRWASRQAGHVLKGNVNGTDLFLPLCKLAAEKGLKLAFVGAAPSVAQRCASRMRDQVPGLDIAYVCDGFDGSLSGGGPGPGGERGRAVVPDEAWIHGTNAARADLLFLALGVPKQDVWLHAHAEALQASVRLGVGALFDFYSGDRVRAPMWMRQRGFEWLFRLWLEPVRLFRRYVLGNPLFVLRTLLLRLHGPEALREGRTASRR